METVITSIILQMKEAGLVDEDEVEVYQFGLECLFLKVIHYLSYLLIGCVLHMIIPMMINAMVFMPLRSKSGGYHAKTRLRCYLLSCITVFLICLLDRVIYPMWLFIVIVFITNMVIICFAPVENDHRSLEQTDIRKFKQQTLLLLGVVDVLIIITVLAGTISISQWLLNGLLVTAVLVFLGICKKKFCL